MKTIRLCVLKDCRIEFEGGAIWVEGWFFDFKLVRIDLAKYLAKLYSKPKHCGRRTNVYSRSYV